MPISISTIGSRIVARPERWLLLWLTTLVLTPALAAEAPPPVPAKANTAPAVSLELLEYLGGIDTMPPSHPGAAAEESRPAPDRPPGPAPAKTATGVKP